MTMKSELSELELASYEGALSRDRDPVVPRGAVVAGEERSPPLAAVKEATGPEEPREAPIPRWRLAELLHEDVPEELKSALMDVFWQAGRLRHDHPHARERLVAAYKRLEVTPGAGP